MGDRMLRVMQNLIEVTSNHPRNIVNIKTMLDTEEINPRSTLSSFKLEAYTEVNTKEAALGSVTSHVSDWRVFLHDFDNSWVLPNNYDSAIIILIMVSFIVPAGTYHRHKP